MKNKLLIGLGIFVVVVVGAILFFDYYLEKEIASQLENEFGNSALSYEDISVNVLKGNAALSKIAFEKGKISFSADDIKVRNLSYSDYILNGSIGIGELRLIKPQVKLNNDNAEVKESSEENNKEFEQQIKVNLVNIENGSLRIVENDTAVLDNLFLSIKTLNLNDVFLDESTLKNEIPFKYESVDVESDSLLYDMNADLTLTVAEFSFQNKELLLNEFKLTPKYDRAEFDARIPYEKDHIDLLVKSVLLKELRWETQRDSFFLQSQKVVIENADLNVYRNKLLPDDESIKPMYSEMIRNLGFKLKLDSIQINNSRIVYEEKVSETRGSGKLSFNDVQVSIENLSNVNMNAEDFPEVNVKAEALFMDESHLTLNWVFDVSDKTDAFQVNGRMEDLRAQAINSFLKPAVNIETEGSIKFLSYNFYGNKHEAKGDMQMGFRDFKVSILKDDGSEEKSFLSDLANLVLKNTVVNEDVEQKEVEVIRDKTKSIWNFLWMCIKNGALKTFL